MLNYTGWVIFFPEMFANSDTEDHRLPFVPPASRPAVPPVTGSSVPASGRPVLVGTGGWQPAAQLLPAAPWRPPRAVAAEFQPGVTVRVRCCEALCPGIGLQGRQRARGSCADLPGTGVSLANDTVLMHRGPSGQGHRQCQDHASVPRERECCECPRR